MKMCHYHTLFLGTIISAEAWPESPDSVPVGMVVPPALQEVGGG